MEETLPLILLVGGCLVGGLVLSVFWNWLRARGGR